MNVYEWMDEKKIIYVLKSWRESEEIEMNTFR